jgi:hypothetical protein
MGTPFFILATGQSNIYVNGNGVPFSWSPNPRAKVWNNVRDNDTSIGSAFTALNSSRIDMTVKYAHNVAQADVNKDVYTAIYARGGRDISSWFGGCQYNYPSGGASGIAFNATANVATQMFVSTRDALGILRPYSTADIRTGEYVWVKQGAAAYRYLINGIAANNADGVTLNIAYVSGSGGINPGVVQVEFQPRFLAMIENSVPAALAAAGTSTVDVVLWWQGESDAENNTNYKNEFEFVISYLGAKSWWGPNTKLLICGMNSTANNGMPSSDVQNTRFAQLAAASSNRYFVNTAAGVPASAWADIYHMTAAGYSAAGDYAMTVYNPPLVGGGGVDPPPPPPPPPTTGTITGMYAGAATVIMDVTTAAQHTFVGQAAYGLWIDGPPRPYRNHTGNVYVTLSHSENYRFRVPSWTNGSSWVLEGPIMMSARVAAESSYNNRQWLWGMWSTGSTIYNITHHEWYRTMSTQGGVPGFNALNFTGIEGDVNREWVNGIGHATSTDGGATFTMVPNNNSSRMVLVPEPWAVQSPRHMYGFFHPSNIVKEGSYYYCAVEQRSVVNAAAHNAVGGVVLIRTLNIASPTGWEYWSGSSWVVVDHGSYQGNLSSQQPKMFFQRTNDYYNSSAYDSSMCQNLRYHTPTGQWLMFGLAGTSPDYLAYSVSPTLANPQFNTHVGIPHDPSNRLYPYVAVFDESSSDLNFQNIGNTLTLLAVDDTLSKIRRSVITVTVNTGPVTPTYSVTPSATAVNEGQTVTFNITTTNVTNGTVLYWTNNGTTTGADFTNGAVSGSVTISGNAGSVSMTLVNDSLTEGAQTIIFRLRTGSVSGTIVATAATVTVADTSVPTTPTYSITPSATTVNEGQTVTFNIATTNVANGTLYWTNAGTTTGADFSGGANSGTVSISSNSGSITRTLLNDVALEGNETIIIQLRTGSTSGTVVATSSTVTVSDTSVPVTPTYAVSPSVPSVNEGQSVTYTVSTTNVANGTTVYWTTQGSVAAADFTDGVLSGSVTINSNTGSFTRSLVSDLTTEGNETMTIQIRTGSIVGAVVATASSVTVVDTSQAPVSTSKLWFRPASSTWIEGALATGLRYRDEFGAWVNKTATLAGVAVRNAANNGWITFAGIQPPTYSIAPSASNVNEGQSVIYTITTTNFGNGTLYWTNGGTSTGADFTDGLNQGSIAITNNVGTLTRAILADGISEGTETLIIQLRVNSVSGAIVSTASTVTVNDTSTPTPSYSVSSSTTSISEGQTVTFTITTTNVGSATLYWTNSGTTTGADFSGGANSGSVVISGNTGTVTRTLVNDTTTEGNETIVFQLRTGSTSGPVVATAPVVTVIDSSTAATVTSLTMNRNNLDFYFFPQTVAISSDGYVDYRVQVTTSNFFNFATNPSDHLVFAFDAAGGQGSGNPHCGPIIRNGRNLYSTARGFLISRNGNVMIERWNGTANPDVLQVTNTSGASFNPLTGTYFIRIRAGYPGSFAYANLMTITITKDNLGGEVVFQGSATGFNFPNTGSTQGIIGAIALPYDGATPQNGCTESTAPGSAYGGSVPFSNFQIVGY